METTLSAEQVLEEYGVKHDNTWDGKYYSKDSVLDAMKEYASIQIQAHLNEAAERAKVIVLNDHMPMDMHEYGIDKQSITNTPINLK